MTDLAVAITVKDSAGLATSATSTITVTTAGPVVVPINFTLASGTTTPDQFIGNIAFTGSKPTAWSITAGDAAKNFAIYLQTNGSANLRTSDGTSAGGGGGPQPSPGLHNLTIKATNSGGSGTAAVVVSLGVVDTVAPSVPTNVRAVENPGVAVNLSWTASADNVSVKGYNVFRNGTKIATSAGTTYADTGPLTVGSYTYTVSAFDAAGNTSAQSVQIIATITLPISPSGGGGTFQDGFANAPAGPAQYPTLFSGYAVRPPWKVAGVDYAVGYPTGQTFTDIRTSQPPNTGLGGTGNNTLFVNGDNITIDGYDFSQSGGTLVASGNSNITFIRCKFGGTNMTTAGTGIFDFRGANLTVKYCVIDGASTSTDGSQCIFFVFPQNVGGVSSGNIVFQYNWFKNYGSQIVEFLNSANLDYRYNLIDDTVVPTGAHGNFLQWGGGSVTGAVFAFNTSRQLNNHNAAEGPQWYFNTSGTMANATCSNNTFIAPGTSGSNMSNIIHGNNSPSGTCRAENNYFDPSGTIFNPTNGAGAYYPASMTGWVTGGSINLNDGSNIPPGA